VSLLTRAAIVMAVSEIRTRSTTFATTLAVTATTRGNFTGATVNAKMPAATTPLSAASPQRPSLAAETAVAPDSITANIGFNCTFAAVYQPPKPPPLASAEHTVDRYRMGSRVVPHTPRQRWPPGEDDDRGAEPTRNEKRRRYGAEEAESDRDGIDTEAALGVYSKNSGPSRSTAARMFSRVTRSRTIR